MEKRNVLFVIDPQFDFCDPNGALYVPGADQDMKRLYTWVYKNVQYLDGFVVSVDSHQLPSVFFYDWFVDAQEKPVEPFNTITSADLISGKVKAVHQPDDTLRYVQYLEETPEKYSLTVWPHHCLIRTKGHELNDDLVSAIAFWKRNHLDLEYEYIIKGLDTLMEQYGAFYPETRFPNPATMMFAKQYADKIADHTHIFIAGEAASHCVPYSVEQLITLRPDCVSKIIFLTDCMSPVKGYEADTQKWMKKFEAQGIRFMTTAEVALKSFE
jgi:nicotinamidase/pyrazinamidase